MTNRERQVRDSRSISAVVWSAFWLLAILAVLT